MRSLTRISLPVSVNSVWLSQRQICLENSLRRLLEPFVLVESTSSGVCAPGDWCVEIEVAAHVEQSSNDFSGEGQRTYLHSGVYGWMSRSPNRHIYVRDDLPAKYELHSKKRQLRITYGDCLEAKICIDVLQIVRSLLVWQAHLEGWLRLHGAVLALGQHGYLLVGAKGAGKTSFLISSLNSQANASFVTNDKLLIRRRGKTTFSAGLPYAIPIATQCIKSTSWLQSLPQDRRLGKKTYVWPADLANSVDRRLQPTAVISKVVVCDLRLREEDVNLEFLDSCAGWLEVREALVDVKDRVTPAWLPGVTDVFAVQENEIADMLLELPWLKLSGNPWTMAGQNSLMAFLEV